MGGASGACNLLPTCVGGIIASTALAACQPEAETAAPEARPVRTVTVERRDAGAPVVLTGRIEAQDQAALGFRISGRMIERAVNVGDRVAAGQLIGRLEPQNEQNALRSAKANLVAAQAQLTQARNHFERQETLFGQGWTTAPLFDQAKEGRDDRAIAGGRRRGATEEPRMIS